MTVDWRRFFLKAGIPKGVAERYSLEFEKNRITADMLPDIDKSILTDLGVTTIGDQLAILKAAKVHHKELQLKGEESRIRVRIAGPDSSVSTSNSHRGRTAPDAHEIYHVKLPDGTTERSQKILQKRKILVANGLPVRGTGVRQGGRDVSPVDKRSSAVIKMRRDRDLVEVTSSSDRAAISRLGVRGLHSDDGRSRIRVVGGRISKQGNFGGTNMLSRALTTHSEHDDRVMVGMPARQRITTSGRLQTSAKSSISRVTVNPSSNRLKPMKQRITGNSMDAFRLFVLARTSLNAPLERYSNLYSIMHLNKN
ncbi:hypothetical protein WR25_18685 [Diploscapter pachys]|uniref:SAM domain-containing protein n=1 Tax=Diploscapter pachys TaxID=2018661 RepID=A0A2A2JAP9_9BILA|nr:hypothetical protein WR25_18685 [Diploscapter pachys]